MTVATDDLPTLLAAGERAVFHGAPAAAVPDLERAAVQARSEGRYAEVTAAAWLLGVALSASGRYGSSLTVLLPLLDGGEAAESTAETRLFAALAAATAASVHRSIGRHDIAQALDSRGLALTDGTGEAGFDCLLGLAADAVGKDDRSSAAEWIQAAEQVAEVHGDDWWRQRVRLDWGRCEVALLNGDPDEAFMHAANSVERAESARAPRHVAKGLLFQSVSALQTGSDAVSLLRRSAMLADSVGVTPVFWQAKALLGALLVDEHPEAGAAALSSARSVVLSIAGDLPPELREQWLDRPNVAALLGG